MGSQISEVRKGNLQVVEEEETRRTGKFLLGNSETMGHGVREGPGGGSSSQQALPKALLFTILYANQAKATPEDSLPRGGLSI